MRGVDDLVGGAGDDERRRRDLADAGRRRRWPTPAAACACQASSGCASRDPVVLDLLDHRLVVRLRERVADEDAEALVRRQVERLSDQPHGLLGHRERVRPARRRAREDEPVDALRVRERELLRDHPAEARLRRRARARRLPRRERPRRHRPSSERSTGRAGGRCRRSRGCRTDHAEAPGERLEHGPPAPAAGIAEPVDQQQRRPAPCSSQAILVPSAIVAITLALRRRRPGGALEQPQPPAARLRVASPAIPPGRKKTMRMKITPRTKSGSESGVRRKPGQTLHGVRRRGRGKALVGERVERSRRSARPSACRCRRGRP